MEEVIISPSSPSIAFPWSQDSAPTVQERLQFIVQNQPNWWSYAIFWQTTKDENGCLCLVWGDGHFQDNKYMSSKLCSFDDKKKNNSELQTLSLDLEIPLDGDVMDAEWFYVMSVTRTFSSRDCIPGKAFYTSSLVWLIGAHELQLSNCERAKEAHMHGIETFICIPTSNGVLEMGSPDRVTKNWALVQQAKSTFGSDSVPFIQFNSIHLQDENITLTDIGLFACTDEQQNTRAKIQDANTESERSDTDCHLVGMKPTNEVKIPKKRGRKPGIRGEALVNHVEAERQRREKLNSRFYALRAIVPNVSRMDKASLLADAVSYIKQLKAKTDELDSKLWKNSKKIKLDTVDTLDNQSTTTASIDQSNSPHPADVKTQADGSPLDIDVKFIGRDAIIRAQSANVNYPGARLMDVLRVLELQVHHVSISVVNNTMLQDVVVRIPEDMKTEDGLKDAILSRF